MNDLEQFIKANRDVFDSEEPRADHFELFEIKRNENRKTNPLLSLAKLAAIFLVLVAFGTLLFYSISRNDLPKITRNNELERVEWYYDALKQEKLSIIETATQRGLLSQDLRNDIFCRAAEFDAKNEQLKRVLNTSERAQNELIVVNQLFVERLDMIVNMLQQNN
ncbi:MAG: hypothetical protein LBM67_04600 [Lentimicrobiaceae bacterium]|jgi:hypothetical protein|nr:hypothetical protein [Lentimicrobiaceae bacterium]